MNKKKTTVISENQERIDELEKDIKDIKLSIDDQDIPEETRLELKESLSSMKEELNHLKEENEKKIQIEKKKNEKPQYMFGDKPIKESSVNDMESAWNKRMQIVKALEGKAKTKSILSSNEVSPESQQ